MTSCAFTRGESNSGRESDFGTTPALDINSRTGISFFQRGTNEINLIAMHNIINY